MQLDSSTKQDHGYSERQQCTKLYTYTIHINVFAQGFCPQTLAGVD